MSFRRTELERDKVESDAQKGERPLMNMLFGSYVLCFLGLRGLMTDISSDFETMLSQTTPEQLAGDPILRKAFKVAMLASDFYLPVEGTAEDQAAAGGISLQAVMINEKPHVVLFSSEGRMNAFAPTGTRFARASGASFFPSLLGNYAILNPGPAGLVLTPDDIAEILGKATPQPSACEAPGHVHGPGCQH